MKSTRKSIVWAGLLLLWQPALAARTDWRQMTIGHFHLYSTLGDSKTRDVAGVGVDMHQWIPMDRLLAVKQSDPEYHAERLAPQFYGESWALVHLLLFDDQSLRRPTANYLDNLDVGVPEPEAFTHAFPFDKNTLDLTVRKLIDNRVIHIKRLTYPEGVALDDAPISSLTAPQADAEIARMGLLIGWPKQTLGPLAAAALKRNPADAAVRALCALVAARDGEKQDIADLISVLAQGGTDYAQMRMDVAATLMSQNPSKEAAEQAYTMLFDLAHSDDPPLEAVALWAAAAEQADIDPLKLLTVLERNSVRAPHNTQMLRDLAWIHEAMGDKPKARADYDRIVLVSDHSEERLWAQKQADSARLRSD